MKDFPSCFGENGVKVADFSSSNSNKAAQNVVNCVYYCRFHGQSCWITVNWSKSLMGQGFSVGIDNSSSQCLCKMDVKPWLFSRKKGSKGLESDLCEINIFWDLTMAEFGPGPEPLGGFYVGIVFEKQMVLLLGDMRREAFKRAMGAVPAPSSAVFVSKREHILGRRVYNTKAQFSGIGRVHDLVIECDMVSGSSEPCLVIRVDSKPVMQVKRLRWKFRGNHTVVVDGVAVEVFWDAHNWLFGPAHGDAIFMFKTRESGEGLWEGQMPLYDPNTLHWSRSQRFRDSQLQDLGFSLILHAWKNE